MSIQLRCLLIVGSVLTLIYFLSMVRKSKLKIEDSIFWIIFSFVIMLLSFFPRVIEYIADALGIISTVNFVFLVIIFVLLIKTFSLTIKTSALTSKMEQLAQRYALGSCAEKNNACEQATHTEGKADEGRDS